MENNSTDKVNVDVVAEPKIPVSEDQIDAASIRFTAKSYNSSQQSKNPSISQPLLIDDQCAYYDMNNEHRGYAIILNHFRFDSKKLPNRFGTEVDCKRLQQTFRELNFKVKTYNDLTRTEIATKLKKVAAADHYNNDCVVVIVLSHGEAGRLEARDGNYDVEEIWEPFVGCQTLVGKPKLFFIQACRGEATDAGISVMSISITDAIKTSGDMIDSKFPKTTKTFKIPSMADILIMHSTYEGHYAFRNALNGSFFIESLCEEFDANGKNEDLFKILTAVCRRVAFGFQSNSNSSDLHEKKQMPSIISMLTKTLYFTKKVVTKTTTIDDIDVKPNICSI